MLNVKYELLLKILFVIRHIIFRPMDNCTNGILLLEYFPPIESIMYLRYMVEHFSSHVSRHYTCNCGRNSTNDITF